MITLDMVKQSLETLEPRMVVPEDIRNKARQSLERMLAISGGKKA